MRKNIHKNRQGFTIIELLVVIVIIGILVALALPNLFSAQARGRDTDRKNELKNLQQRLETHFNDEGEYPPGSDMAAAAAVIGITSADAAQYTGPRNDVYTYTGTGTCDTNGCSSFTLSAVLENDKDPDANDSGAYVLASVN